MKHFLSIGLLFLLLILSTFKVKAACVSDTTVQTKHTLPSVNVKTLDNRNVNFSTLENNGKPMLIHFWATWCSHCHNQLDNIAEVYDEWQTETGVKVIAVSMDDARTMNKVEPFVAGKSWDFEIYLDPNGDLKRSMNVNRMPHTFIVNGNGEIVWQANSYSDGDEEDMYQIIKTL